MNKSDLSKPNPIFNGNYINYMLKKVFDSLMSILPDSYLLYQYLSLCFIVNPDPIVVKTLCVLITCEFIMVHAGIFMVVSQRKISIIFFIIVYGLFTYQFDKMLPLKDHRIMIGYFIVVLFRMRFALFNLSEKQHDRMLGFSGGAAIIYIFAIGFCVIFADSLPKLNYTKGFVSEIAFYKNYALSKEATVLICTGSIYYSLMVFSYISNDYLEFKELKKQQKLNVK